MKYLLQLFAVVSLLGCSTQTDARLTGTIDNSLNGKEVYLQRISETAAIETMDTAVVDNGQFVFPNFYTDNPDMRLLAFEGLEGNIVVVAEPETIEVTVYKDSLRKSTVSGGPENTFFQEYLKEIQTINTKKGELQQEFFQARREGDLARTEEIKKTITKMDSTTLATRSEKIRRKPGSIVAMVMLSDLLSLNIIKGEQADQLYQSFDPKIQESVLGQNIEEGIARLKSRELAAKTAEIGNKAPEFSAPTPSGETLALSETLGKYTIIDFWASWCAPCRIENPNVVRAYQQYHDKGLNIISVSLDKPNQAEKWKQAIEKDNMDWYHVSNLQFWDDPIARRYGVRSIPTTFLLDENGVIIAKNLRGDALQAKLAELLGDDV
ncbi:redoxin domain-containing protein [Croceiramulus getboli]|nr:TlpA disulfide reductase family protein [Flavobacteriaceae bacterium YJPT1-3]